MYNILGATDALTASLLSRDKNIHYIWASSLVMSALLGFSDDGMTDASRCIPIIQALTKGSHKPVILDFDIGGKDLKEFNTNLSIIKNTEIGGICIEDESWPKFNAMLNVDRKLSSPYSMGEKIKCIKNTLATDTLLIARTHALIAGESSLTLQQRIDTYSAAGADVICIHYTGDAWDIYYETISNLKIPKPLLLILSRRNSIPEDLLNCKDINYVLYPNQIYRSMLGNIKQQIARSNGAISNGNLEIETANMMTVTDLFNEIEKIVNS